jgi:hypothetical protein
MQTLTNLRRKLMFKVEINYCDCHPETCCCRDYKIVDTKDGSVYLTGDVKKILQEICDLKNGACEGYCGVCNDCVRGELM